MGERDCPSAGADGVGGVLVTAPKMPRAHAATLAHIAYNRAVPITSVNATCADWLEARDLIEREGMHDNGASRFAAFTPTNKGKAWLMGLRASLGAKLAAEGAWLSRESRDGVVSVSVAGDVVVSLSAMKASSLIGQRDWRGCRVWMDEQPRVRSEVEG